MNASPWKWAWLKWLLLSALLIACGGGKCLSPTDLAQVIGGADVRTVLAEND